MPSLRSTPARSTLPPVGASTCASGSQVWKGTIGTLTAKPASSARNTIICSQPPAAVIGSGWTFMPSVRASMSNVTVLVWAVCQSTMASRPRKVNTLPASV